MAQTSQTGKSVRTRRLRRLRTRYLSVQGMGTIGWKVVRFVLLFGLCYIILYPFFMKILNAFKGTNDFLDPTIRFLPKHFTLDHILNVIREIDYFTSLRNSALISFVVAFFQMAVSALVGYGFARFKFRFNGLLFFFVILTLIVPPSTIIIPLYLRFRFFAGFINLINTPLPMFILAMTGMGIKNGLYIFLFRQHFRGIPKELEEASWLDGCGEFRTFFKIMLPSAKSMLITSFVLSFSWQWTDQLYNSLFFTDLPVLPNMINGVGAGQIPIIVSKYVNIAAILSILPIALVYVLAQKFIIQSIDSSGLVG